MKSQTRQPSINHSRWYRHLQYFANRLHMGYPFNTVKKKITGAGNHTTYQKSILSSVSFDIQGNQNRILIKKNCFLNNVRFYIRGDNHTIIISEQCCFSRGGDIWFEDRDCSLTIAEQSTFEDVHIAVTEPGSSVSIGKNCMFAYDIDVRTGDSHSIISSVDGKRINYAQDIAIGDHVWVAAHCSLLKGVSVSDNSIVATGSVVTKPFQEGNVIIAGNPARIVTKNVTWLRERV